MARASVKSPSRVVDPQEVSEGEVSEEAYLDGIDFTKTVAPFDRDHVRLCRHKFTKTSLVDFVSMMRRAKKIDIDPLSDIWQMVDGTFIIRAAAMFEFANRTGRYAPGDHAVAFEVDDTLKGDANPEGLIACRVSIKVRTEDAVWHNCWGEAYWNDLVPLTGGKRNDLTGRYEGGWINDASGWASMPRTMLRKCAFVDALKKAFPELGTFYVKEEMDATGNQPGVSVSDARPLRDAPIGPTISPDGVRRARAREIANGTTQPTPARIPATTVRWTSGVQEIIELPAFYAKVVETFDTYSPPEVIRWFDENLTAREDFWRWDKQNNGSTNAVALKKLLDEAKAAPPTRKPTVSLRATPRTRRKRETLEGAKA